MKPEGASCDVSTVPIPLFWLIKQVESRLFNKNKFIHQSNKLQKDIFWWFKNCYVETSL